MIRHFRNILRKYPGQCRLTCHSSVAYQWCATSGAPRSFHFNNGARHVHTRRQIGDCDDLSDALNITLYRLVQEGLTNVSKFARNARVEIYLARGQGEIVVTMTDDGPGINLSKPHKGLGLVGMRERVEALGGEFHIASRLGEGFLICARVPVQPLPSDISDPSAEPVKSAK